MQALTNTEKQTLLSVADQAILEGLETREYLRLDLKKYSAPLQVMQACFVTLEENNQLRGCMGSLKARMPLVQDVAVNAFNAAFRDPRFAPVKKLEYPKVSKYISVLSQPEPIEFTSEEDLISKLRPGVDGLILTDQDRQGTFLPSVWASLPTPMVFLQHLKNKAGLASDHWSDTLRVDRYTAQRIE